MLRHTQTQTKLRLVGGTIKPVVIDSFWHKRINEATTFLAFVIFCLYLWTTFLDPNPVTHPIQLVTVLVAAASVATGAFARLFAETKGAFARSLAAYLLLIAAISFLLYDTAGISSPYIFLWPLAAAFAGLFGAWGSAPVFIIALGYLGALFMNHSLSPSNSLPTILIAATPIIFSIIVWSHVRQLSSYRQQGRDPAAYKQRPTEITNLIQESEMLINAIGDAILAVDNQGVIQLINPAAQSLLGWSHHDALSLQYQSVLKLTDDQDKELTDTTDPIKQALNTNQETRAKSLRIETKGGKKRFVSLVASPLGEMGNGAIAIIRDITKERSEEREQAEFISTASHEMRTPVASIEGYLGLALNPATATIDDKARDFITKAHESAEHLGRLFQDLLDVSKAEDGRLSNTPVVLDIVEFAGEVIEGLQQKATDKGLNLVYQPTPKAGEKGERSLSPVYYVNLDKDHIREIVNNLTENAIKYTPAGEVSINITGDDEHIVISVTDSGIGIPTEDIPHLFQKFYRVDNTDTREIGGTGLGLYLCRRLVETLGGRIWAESVYKQGSTFFVELPRIGTAQAQQLLGQQARVSTSASAPVAAPAYTAPTPAVSPVVAPPQAAPPPIVTAAPIPPVAPTPLAPPIPLTVAAVPVTPTPQPVAPTLVIPAPRGAVPAQPRINTPLSSIEQDPTSYAQQTRQSPMTPRNPNQQN